MAQDAYLTDNPEALDISRQRKLAEMLTLKAFEQPQGNMISGHYVAPSWTQQLAPLVSGIAGQAMGAKLDEKQLKLSEALRTKGQEEVTAILDLAKTDPNAALKLATTAQSSQAKSLAATLMQNALPKKTDKLIEYETYKSEGGKLPFTEWVNRLTPEQEEKLKIDRQRLGLEGARLNLEQAKAAQELAMGKPLTESQGKATSFGGGALEGNNIMKSLEDKGFDPSTFYNQSQITAARTGVIGNKIASPEAQQYQNAMDLFGNNYLRYQSGANMPIKEIQENLALMTPRMGDSKEKLTQKANARLVAIKGMEASAGPSGKKQMHQSTTQGQNDSTITPSLTKPATNLQFDPALLQYMTPEQRKLFGA